MKKKGICAICGKTYDDYGNNPEPLMPFENRVCNECNSNYVIPARLLELTGADCIKIAFNNIKSQ